MNIKEYLYVVKWYILSFVIIILIVYLYIYILIILDFNEFN